MDGVQGNLFCTTTTNEWYETRTLTAGPPQPQLVSPSHMAIPLISKAPEQGSHPCVPTYL